MIEVDSHPLLRAVAFQTSFPKPLGELEVQASLVELLGVDADAPLSRDEEVRQAVRNLLRHGGYKPTGRGKPASEYLVRAAGADSLSSINAAVDACNAVSLHSGLPISVVDLDLAGLPLRIGIAPAESEFEFNAAGQTIRIGGLLCLFDAAGPCANGVKDCQRTKTHAGTVRTMSVVWGCSGHEERLVRAVDWYRELLESSGASCVDEALVHEPA